MNILLEPYRQHKPLKLHAYQYNVNSFDRGVIYFAEGGGNISPQIAGQ